MKRYLLLSFFFLTFIGAFAQNISVKSFQALPMDMTASSLEGKKTDQNGNVAALIKVVTAEKDFSFEGGTLGIVDSQVRKGEIWVWVPRGLRKITILHDKLGVLRDYRFPIEIESERTYEMVLTTAKIETIVKEEIKEQYLVFQVTPPDAVLEVNDQMWTLSSNGSVSRLVNFGTYTYRVQASNYYPDAGNVVVNDPDNTKLVTVNLKPNFGWIEVKGDGVLQGAAVYVDNALLGKAPCKSGTLRSGTHSVRISKEMYEAYTTSVTVNDNETTVLSPNLSADFARLTFQVDADAEIWVNNERKGIRTWTGDLATGVYRIECKQTNHEPTSTTKEVTSRMNGEVVRLDAPKPICGTLMVESDPPLAAIYIDGQSMGQTPKLIKEILIGQHELRLTKDGYADYTETITIVKGERKQVTATLSNGREVQFTCNVPNATLEIDGQRIGSASGTYMLTYGSHSIRATAAVYLDYSAAINVSGNTRTYGITMQPLRKDEKTITVNGVSFTMKLVEGGTFQMGADDLVARSDEKPVHNVTLSDYYLGETEVTQALWKAVMGTNPSYFKGDNLPVEQVSWNDCQEFIKRLNKLTGKNFRLPTEAEWEYAARGGGKSRGYKYAGGNDIGSIAWYNGNSGSKTHAVKTKSPNELGLYDMSGNVCEWCQDWYGRYSSGSQVNPQGSSSGSLRVLRGGSWRIIGGYCRVSHRIDGDPDYWNYINFGFRLCLPQ